MWAAAILIEVISLLRRLKPAAAIKGA